MKKERVCERERERIDAPFGGQVLCHSIGDMNYCATWQVNLLSGEPLNFLHSFVRVPLVRWTRSRLHSFSLPFNWCLVIVSSKVGANPPIALPVNGVQIVSLSLAPVFIFVSISPPSALSKQQPSCHYCSIKPNCSLSLPSILGPIVIPC